MMESFNEKAATKPTPKTATATQVQCGKCQKPFVKGLCGCPRITVGVRRRSVGI